MDFSNYNISELMLLSKDIEKEHNDLKAEMIKLVNDIEEKRKKINELSEELTIREEIFLKVNEEIKNKK